jgi:hypothetical protein
MRELLSSPGVWLFRLKLRTERGVSRFSNRPRHE